MSILIQSAKHYKCLQKSFVALLQDGVYAQTALLGWSEEDRQAFFDSLYTLNVQSFVARYGDIYGHRKRQDFAGPTLQLGAIGFLQALTSVINQIDIDVISITFDMADVEYDVYTQARRITFDLTNDIVRHSNEYTESSFHYI